MNQNKKLILGILLTFIICIGSAILASYSTGPYGNYPNPGMHPGMIGPGSFNTSGVANPSWNFLGDLEVFGILDMNNHRITNISAPIASSDVVTKGYVDAAIGGGVCYTSYGNSTCYPGFTAVLTGYSTMYFTSYGGQLVCSPITHLSPSAEHIYATSSHFRERLDKEPCAICCK